ncbi:trimeric intracellular cation channel family protein [Marivivens sp. LCG002]|uniref:trimeric intracellular cation channel family protein n=1 Tax=Marivivens sp. LCG002 TaxID=3051171 RepID=UPI00255425D5|nr:trimeric intracellular cation channel family protein [Marivivens sp. LCG002]WIV51200.1 trimeric intracellular cation channel family protein [Marivivens sp. LCG002]
MLYTLDLFATVVFAITGALAASRKEMDILGFLWLGAAAGVGGGTLRDLILDQPVFWTVSPAALIASLVAAALMHFIAPIFQSRIKVIIWLDAFGMAFAAIAGTVKCIGLETSGLVAVVLGVFTASAGGITRDLLAQEPSIILKRDIYVTAAATGATTVVLLHAFGLSLEISSAIGFAVAIVLRGAAIAFGWTLPVFKSRPAR